MITVEKTVAWLGLRATDMDGDTVGKIEGVYVDRLDGRPRWLVLTSGRFGARSVLVPVAGAASGNGIVMTAVTRGQVRTAPRPTFSLAPLAARDDRELARHYRLWPRLRELSSSPDHVTSAHPLMTRRSTPAATRVDRAAA
jgi:hypothetical protein